MSAGISQAIDLEALGKLLSLAKSLEGVSENTKAIERVLLRTTPEGQLAFQVKGGMLWRFFAITLPGREKEYDLGQNLAQLQSLFVSISGPSDQEIRRAAQGMAMYGETVIDTTDAVAALIGLQTALNSIIDYVKQNKLRRQTDEERKKSIVDALEAMKINWRPNVAPPIKPRKKRVVA
ncbi:MAG: hypothetical protein JSR37_06905 [Verrucomicrobia bacterium]|nr:hypothetical protein [Verrucomicrobiota bacterium]MBS0637658.1 hypothetical protein [Verrucomicrobiota bacterium]